MPTRTRDCLRAEVGPYAAISERDRRILSLSARKIGDGWAGHRVGLGIDIGVHMGVPTRVDFGEAVRALREVVEEEIPSGRVFLLATTAFGPVVGSLVSGVGLVASARGVSIVHVGRDISLTDLGDFRP